MTSPGSARNRGAELATHDLIFFLDADDLNREDHLFECCRDPGDPAVDRVKTGVASSHPVHVEWRWPIDNSLAINLAVRRRCHPFIGGFPNVHLLRRSGDAFQP